MIKLIIRFNKIMIIVKVILNIVKVYNKKMIIYKMN